MGQPFVGEIRLFAGNFNPAGWAFCNGQLMPISENDILFQLIGTTYGGDGQTTFNLPDLQGRFPLHAGSRNGSSYVNGQAAGVESVTLTTQQIPQHNHAFLASTDPGSLPSPANNVLGALSPVSIYKPSAAAPSNAMNAQSIGVAGGNQPHDNMHPYLCVSFIISLFGVFPTQN